MIVNVHNGYGSTLGAMYVNVIVPEIKNISVRVNCCNDPTCQFSLPTCLALPIFPPLEEESDSLLPLWYFDELQEEKNTTTTPPTVETTPSLPPMTYHVNTKVCFHVSILTTNTACCSSAVQNTNFEFVN